MNSYLLSSIALLLSLRLTTSQEAGALRMLRSTEAMCRNNFGCAVLGLTGHCCPTRHGLMLDCCDEEKEQQHATTVISGVSNQCADHPLCVGLAGACCPTRDGVFLDCCGSQAPMVPSNAPSDLPSMVPSDLPSMVPTDLPSTIVASTLPTIVSTTETSDILEELQANGIHSSNTTTTIKTTNVESPTMMPSQALFEANQVEEEENHEGPCRRRNMTRNMSRRMRRGNCSD